MLPLIFSVKRSIHRRDDPAREHADKSYLAVRPKILERDDFTCQYCDLTSQKFQEVHHVDDNHKNNDESNLKTICCLCHAVMHIWFSGLSARGELIYIEPQNGVDFSQADLNQLVRALWIAEEGADKSLAAIATARLTALAHGAKEAYERVGTNDLCILGDRLLQMSDAEYLKRASYWKGFYVLPKKSAFNHQIKHWRAESVLPTAWYGMARNKISSWLKNKGLEDTIASIKRLLSIGD